MWIILDDWEIGRILKEIGGYRGLVYSGSGEEVGE